jgi:tRNA(Arg) A34 adenosine deaminase TadA
VLLQKTNTAQKQNFFMKEPPYTFDEKFIKKCIGLSKTSIQKGDAPFGSLIVKNGIVIAQSINNSKNKIFHHAEIIALDRACQKLRTSNLSACTLYSNCEPCPMCAFMIREYKIGKVVFALPSPFMGGYSKWKVLQDTEISRFRPFFATPPKIIGGVLENEAKKVFNKTPWWMFGSGAKKEEKLRGFASSIFDYPEHKKEIKILMSKLNISKEDIIRAYVGYDTGVFVYDNDIYNSLPLRAALYLHYILKGSWHQERQGVILDFVKRSKPASIVDMGFGAPTKYIKEYVLRHKKQLVLVDLYKSAFTFAKPLLDIWNSSWKGFISFRKLDMNKHEFVGNFDCYIFQDSIEHVKNSKKYLTKIVNLSGAKSNFILSIPIGPKIPSHTIAWATGAEAVGWLTSCGLIIKKSKKVHINPKVDLFTNNPKEFFNLIVLCSKR